MRGALLALALALAATAARAQESAVSQPASQTQPASAPATAATAPSESQPTSQPESAPTSQPESRPEPGTKLLTLEAIYGPEGRVNFSGSYATGLEWLPDGRRYLHRRNGQLQIVDALSDAVVPAYNADALAEALRAHPDFDAEAARRLAARPTLLSQDRDLAIVEHNQRLYTYRFAAGKLARLPPQAAAREELALSPRSRFVSFVRDNNLFAIDLTSGRERQLTRDGDANHLNGILDWVYEEEVYGRGKRRGYWWRDDDQYLAFLRLDETRVPLYTLVDSLPSSPRLEQTPYPKAGDPNPGVLVGMVRPGGGRAVWADLSRYAAGEILIVRVGWAPDGMLIYQVQDREQRWLDLNQADPATGRSRTLLRESTPAWVEPLGEPVWLEDGTFLWLSERDGWRHIYHYRRDGRLVRRVTSGDWEVRDIHGFDPRGGWVYFSGTRDSAIESHGYRVPLEGGPVQRLTEPGYSHRVEFDPTFQRFFDTFSNIHTPPKVYLRSAEGELLRVISDNPVDVLAEYHLGQPEFLRVPARDGCLLNALILRPPDFDPNRQYPVWSEVYGGPQAPTVRNRWGGEGYLFKQMLAQQGYLVWVCDPRSASGEGAILAWQAYRRLGERELEDLEDALDWLARQGYVDPQRIGIEGHSYGGFMTAYALTHSKRFKVGVAGAPVLDWRNYDTIYTERYMQTPQNNPEGYERTSVIKAAKDLNGRLLLLHGKIDDNVHFQNSAQFIDELQRAGKMFDLMIYPRDRHGIHRGAAHYRQLRLRYILDNL